MGVLKLKSKDVLKIIQDGYRSQNPGYIVVMFRDKRGVLYDEYVVSKTLNDLYSQVEKEFQLEEHIKQDVGEGNFDKIELGYIQFHGGPGMEMITGHYIPDILFATADDADAFNTIAKEEVNNILRYYKGTHSHN